jgi:hypothetical protein
MEAEMKVQSVKNSPFKKSNDFSILNILMRGSPESTGSQDLTRSHDPPFSSHDQISLATAHQTHRFIRSSSSLLETSVYKLLDTDTREVPASSSSDVEWSEGWNHSRRIEEPLTLIPRRVTKTEG